MGSLLCLLYLFTVESKSTVTGAPESGLISMRGAEGELITGKGFTPCLVISAPH